MKLMSLAEVHKTCQDRVYLCIPACLHLEFYQLQKSNFIHFHSHSSVMAPVRTKLNASSLAHDDIDDPPSRHQIVSIQSPARTPASSPRKKAVGITQGQKQALIDNLQLEGEHMFFDYTLEQSN